MAHAFILSDKTKPNPTSVNRRCPLPLIVGLISWRFLIELTLATVPQMQTPLQRR